MRLLHSIISRILFPKTERFDFISERDFVQMHCVIKEIPVSLPRLMIIYMSEVASRANTSLPYGMVIILILREFRIPIFEEEPKKLLRYTDIYNV